MAFSLPTFNLTVDIYTGPWVSKVLRVTTAGNFAFGRRVNAQVPEGGEVETAISGAFPLLLLPAFTDVRSRVLSNVNDVVEIPQGSGRWYGVAAVEDIGKGFSNEHRCAFVQQISKYVDPTLYSGLTWPVPMP